MVSTVRIIGNGTSREVLAASKHQSKIGFHSMNSQPQLKSRSPVSSHLSLNLGPTTPYA